MENRKIYDELYGMIEDLKRKVSGIKPGDAVTITPALDDGTKIADYTIGEAEGSLFAPTPPAPYTPLDYSTDEQDTGRKWIDGRAVYEKTFYSENDIAVNTSGVDIAALASMVSVVDQFISATAFYNGGKSTLPILLQNYDSKITAFAWMNAGINGIVMRYVKPAPSPEPENNTKKRRK